MDEARWGQVSALLDELFDLDAERREARLAGLAEEDPALAAELQRLLAADARSGVLDSGVFSGSATLASAFAGDTARPTPEGLRLGHYRLVERVGSGGMGEVWRAQREDDFQQQVAVKLIRPLVDGPALRERFARERQILARLDHPNIARLLDGGLADDGTPWYAMEFVRGVPLNTHVRDEQLDVRARVRLLLQVCEAVAHAHTQLVVHRDLKPSNILVDGEGRVRVLDFGIARLLDDSADVQLTSTGVRVFSPAYAAPEQIRGEPVGTAADVFALGAVLYELLTGEPPFPKRSGQPERLLAQLDDEQTPRPSATLRERSRETARATGALRADEDLDTIVATALQPDPERRYRGALQLAEDLQRWLDGRPIAARPDSAAYRMRKFVTRHRLAVGSAGAVLLALVAGLGLALWQANVARQHAKRADAEAARASAEALRAEAEAAEAREQAKRTRRVKAFFVESFLQADPMRRETGSPSTVSDALDAAIERGRNELSDDPALQSAVLDDFAEIRAGQGRFDEAQALVERAVLLAEAARGPDDPLIAEPLLNLGVIHGLRGDPLAGAEFVERAVAILEQDDGGEPLDLANALGALAAVRQQQGDSQAMREAVERSVDLFRVHAPEDQQLLVGLTNLAMIAESEGRRDEAEAGFKEVVQRVEASLGVESPHLWPSLVALASIAYERGDHVAELALSERALGIARKTYGDDHPWVASSLSEVGWIHARDGDFLRGEPLMREGIAMNQRLGRVQAISAMRRYAIALQHQGQLEASREQLEKAWSLCQAHGVAEAQLCIVVRANRAQLLAYGGRGVEALEEAVAAMQSLGKRAEGLPSEWGQIEQARAAALAAIGQRDAAEALQDSVIERYTLAFGAEHQETRSAVSNRSRLPGRD